MHGEITLTNILRLLTTVVTKFVLQTKIYRILNETTSDSWQELKHGELCP